MKEFEPKVLVFTCNWCSYAGADLAGVSRLQMPPNFRVIRVMCSGRVEPEFIVYALKRGVDGVLVTGCHPGDCHYIKGNYATMRRMAMLKRLLQAHGVEPERFRLEWVSASEAQKFQRVVTEFVEKIKSLGPNPLQKK